MLELQHIKKSYDGVTILEDINLKIKKGEIVSILWPFRMRKDDPSESDPRTYRGGSGKNPV